MTFHKRPIWAEAASPRHSWYSGSLWMDADATVFSNFSRFSLGRMAQHTGGVTGGCEGCLPSVCVLSCPAVGTLGRPTSLLWCHQLRPRVLAGSKLPKAGASAPSGLPPPCPQAECSWGDRLPGRGHTHEMVGGRQRRHPHQPRPGCADLMSVSSV